MIINDLISIGIDNDNEIFQTVKSVYMGCTNKAKGTQQRKTKNKKKKENKITK